ncbi:MAG TPA: YdeI/OmpD-associated family protein [Acidobacteriaceae bacterium]|jgi:hypothetical protein|nr:YdeI/OmpD-associated family protein [Acidobacteriaceae bacterium]
MATVTDGRIVAVDAYINRAGEFAQPVLWYVREVMHAGAPGVVEAMKWSMPFFVYKGVILGNMAAFKAHCSFGLWGTDVVGTLREDGVAQGGNMGSFGKITSVKDLPSRAKLVGYVRLAAKSIADGERTKAWSRPKVVKGEAEVPEALAAALKKNKGAAKTFAAMTPGYRREYCQWIAEAKREETRENRVATAVEWIAEGKGRNWKYESSCAEGEGLRVARR